MCRCDQLPRFSGPFANLAGHGANIPYARAMANEYRDALQAAQRRIDSLERELEKGPVAVVFNRGHWCPYCRLNTVALAGAQRHLGDAGEIVAITPERSLFATKMKDEAGAEFPVLTDLDNGYAMSLNLAFWVGEEMRALMTAGGFVPSLAQGNEAWFLPIPATFVVGTDGRIKSRFIDPYYRKRMEIEELIASLRA